ncbi:hypothetical protein GXW76_12670 [Roseomonas soli]|uniref:Uncharacterized protein n=1 Tax=Neoroseomonas soli TaxID=1081025 RepID=A0A9X9WXZ8_9PROT|nr:hypothetical protein [Neoroseomonas soli]
MLPAVAGCGQTLVFAERSGVNLSIRADATSRPPLAVNFGLDRASGTIVPPRARGEDGRPQGEAINMFAGFQVDRRGEVATQQPVNVDLRVSTQFASGAAALKVAGAPDVVRDIVTLGQFPLAEATPEALQARVAALSRRILGLSPEAARRALTLLGLPSGGADPKRQLREVLSVRNTSADQVAAIESAVRTAAGG